ncbi:MAG: type VI secretion system contractile sheath small subunit [Planctomycetota bacterium]
MSRGSQDMLTKVRPDRVSILMEVDGPGTPKVELPFIAGVVGDFSGNDSKKPKQRMRDRRFVQIDRDNFNQVMERIGPGLSFKAQDTLSGDPDKEQVVNLQFKSMDDFSPANVARQVEPLAKLLELRARLRELQAQVQRDGDLEEALWATVKQTEEAISAVQENGENNDDEGGEQ